jgi:hypothetical protein
MKLQTFSIIFSAARRYGYMEVDDDDDESQMPCHTKIGISTQWLELGPPEEMTTIKAKMSRFDWVCNP